MLTLSGYISSVIISCFLNYIQVEELLIINFGDSVTCRVPIFQGYALPHAI